MRKGEAYHDLSSRTAAAERLSADQVKTDNSGRLLKGGTRRGDSFLSHLTEGGRGQGMCNPRSRSREPVLRKRGDSGGIQ
jgi:hypothetical protein